MKVPASSGVQWPEPPGWRARVSFRPLDLSTTRRQLAAAIAEIMTMSCFMLYLSSYLNSFRHARISMSITFACEPTAASTTLSAADGAHSPVAGSEEASLSGGYTEVAEE